MKLLKEGDLENALLSLLCGAVPQMLKSAQERLFFPAGLLFCLFIFYAGDRVDSLSFRVVCGVEGHERVLGALVLKCWLFTGLTIVECGLV